MLKSLRKTALNIEKLIQKTVTDASLNQKIDSANDSFNANLAISDISHTSHLSLSDFKLIKLLGKGSFGQVYLISSNSSNTMYAMKALRKDVLLEDDDVQSAFLERDALIMGLENRFLVKLICSFQNQVRACLIVVSFHF